MGEPDRQERLCLYHGHRPRHTHADDPVYLFRRGLEGPAYKLRQSDNRLRHHGEPDDLPRQGFDLAREAADGDRRRDGYDRLQLRRERAAAAEDGQQRRYGLLLQRQRVDRAHEGQSNTITCGTARGTLSRSLTAAETPW